MNSCVEIAPHDPKVQEQLRKTLKKMKTGLQTVIERAQEKKLIDPSADAKELALFVVSQAGGMVVLSKAQASRKELQAVAERTLKALR